MDYNATTPLEPEVIKTISEALQDAWGNPSSNYIAGVKAKALINQSRENVARMVGGKAEDIIFASGGTELYYTLQRWFISNKPSFRPITWCSTPAVEHFRRSCRAAEEGEGQQNGSDSLPHIITSNVEHDSVKLVAEQLQKDGKADVTFVSVSKVTARVEVEDVIAAVRPNTCLVSVMLANNETGVIMPVQEICQRIKSLNKQRERLRILLHTDAAQALGKIRVDATELGVDYLTIVGHKFYAPRIGALYVNGPGTGTPLYPMLFGGGQERNFRPGTENTPMIAGLGKAAELVTSNLSDYESHMRSTKLHLEERLKAGGYCPTVRGCWPALAPLATQTVETGKNEVFPPLYAFIPHYTTPLHCTLSPTRPSHILLSCGIPSKVAANALRLSVGRGTTKADVDAVVEDLREAVKRLEEMD
ncbi:Selenocysteine lyase [Larimichthys crocea]|uniref:Uncharacterized protein n=1 Tax=Larimichthys crocea TaxID=215358 RepID=A0ACD3RL71_LARCR|nr:Selenocysteine lyase [Larimichthys crocea]